MNEMAWVRRSSILYALYVLSLQFSLNSEQEKRIFIYGIPQRLTCLAEQIA